MDTTLLGILCYITGLLTCFSCYHLYWNMRWTSQLKEERKQWDNATASLNDAFAVIKKYNKAWWELQTEKLGAKVAAVIDDDRYLQDVSKGGKVEPKEKKD